MEGGKREADGQARRGRMRREAAQKRSYEGSGCEGRCWTMLSGSGKGRGG